jgi:hypothetical protein
LWSVPSRFEDLAASRLWQSFSSTAELIPAAQSQSGLCGGRARHGSCPDRSADVGYRLVDVGIAGGIVPGQPQRLFSAGLCVLIVAVFFLVVLICHGLGQQLSGEACAGRMVSAVDLRSVGRVHFPESLAVERGGT